MQMRFCRLWVSAFLLSVLWVSAGIDAGSNLRTVRLIYQAPARSVCVSGDFNQWSTQRDCMQATQNGWEVKLMLAPGTYRYGFVVDGGQWICDPNALWTEADGFGQKNAVLVVK